MRMGAVQLVAYDHVARPSDLEDALRHRGIEPHVIGGAAIAVELDAKRAIRQGTELVARL
jgi:hypothetical protein